MPAGLDGNPNPIRSDVRSAVIERAGRFVLGQKRNEVPLLIGIDGIDGSGKSTFADELAIWLINEGASVVRATVDSFHNPRSVRYGRGRGSPSGFYLDSHNLQALSDRLLGPLRTGVGGEYRTACFDEPSDTSIDPPPIPITGDEILLFDGIFVCRPELTDFWDSVIYLDGSTRVDPKRPDRYRSGMAMYHEATNPTDRAELVIDNNDLANPAIVASRDPRDGLSKRLASYYDAEAGHRTGRSVDPQRAAWRESFVELVTAEGRSGVFEIGSGPGRDTLALREAGLNVVPLDLSVESTRFLVGEGIPAINGSVYELPLKDRSFDAAWTMSTLMHIPDDRFAAAMTEICRVLKPGAPIGIGLWGGVDREGVNNLGALDLPRFFSLRTNERAREMLAAHGKIERFETKEYYTPELETYQFVVLRVE